jgi:hypothetical protein
MKTIESYQISDIGKVEIREYHDKYDAVYKSEKAGYWEIMLGKCSSRGDARRASEGYLSVLCKNKLEGIANTKEAGWMRQFKIQTPKLNSGEEK